jgi:hypothetical protein
MLDKKVDIEIFAVNDLYGDKRLNLDKKLDQENITLTAHNFDEKIEFQIDKKEALKLASHIFRQVLGLY